MFRPICHSLSNANKCCTCVPKLAKIPSHASTLRGVRGKMRWYNESVVKMEIFASMNFCPSKQHVRKFKKKKKKKMPHYIHFVCRFIKNLKITNIKVCKKKSPKSVKLENFRAQKFKFYNFLMKQEFKWLLCWYLFQFL